MSIRQIIVALAATAALLGAAAPAAHASSRTEPSAHITTRCGISIGDPSDENDFSFVASARIHNTSKVGVRVWLGVVFDQANHDGISARHRILVAAGERHTARIRIPATYTQIKRYQRSPGPRACEVLGGIIGTF